MDALFRAVKLITDRRENMNWEYVKTLKSANLNDDNVAFLNLEDLSVEHIAKTFAKFLELLYG